MSELTCPGCGQTLAERTRFCPLCGARLPEADLPPAPPPGGLRTVVLPPAEADEPPAQPVPAGPPPPGAPPAFPPTVRLDAPPLPVGATLPPPDPGVARRDRRVLWLALGGVGCMSLLLLVACLSAGVFLFMQQQAPASATSASTPVSDSGGAVADAPPLGEGRLLEDDFSDESVSNLDVSEDDLSRSAYEDGAYVIEVKAAETVVWSLVSGPYAGVSVEVEAEVAADSDIAAAGLVFNYQDNANFYLYSVSNDGYYSLELLSDGEWTTLVDPTLSDAVQGARNLLRVEARGERIALYLNGALVEETVDGTFTTGEVGLAVSTFEGSTGTVRFDNLVIDRGE